VCNLDPNVNNTLSYNLIDCQSEIIIAARTCDAHKFTGSEYLTQYVQHANVYYSDTNSSSIGIPTRGTFSKDSAYIDGMSGYQPRTIQEVVRFERANKLNYLDDWQRNMSNEEFYRILYERPDMTNREFYRTFFRLPRETAESFIPSVAHQDHLVRLFKKVIRSSEETSEIYPWFASITHESNFYFFLNRYRTLLSDIAAFKDNFTRLNMDWTEYRYLISQAYRNEAWIARFNEVCVGDYQLMHSRMNDLEYIDWVDTTHYVSHVFVNEVLSGVDATMELTHVFSFLI
jgi:hypothetical protein